MTAKQLCDAQQLELHVAHMDRFHKVLNCDHVWVKYGLGYTCDLCGHYTGTNTALNTLISRELG